MARASDESIILRTRPVGESDLFVTFLTASEGKLTGSAKNARRSRRRFGGGLEPLTRGRATWSERGESELVRLETFEITASFADVQSNLAWFYLFAYLAEVADTFARDREPDPRFFRLLRAATDASRAGAVPGAVRRWFEIWTLRLQGLLPDLEACARCGSRLGGAAVAVRTQSGEPLCQDCSGREDRGEEIDRLSAGEHRWVRLALARPIDRMPVPESTAGIDRLIRHIFVEFTGRPFRSARFLEARP